MARQAQTKRFRCCKIRSNGQMTSRQVREYCQLNTEGKRLLTVSVEELGLSARAHDKVLRLARAIADLADYNAVASNFGQVPVTTTSSGPRPRWIIP